MKVNARILKGLTPDFIKYANLFVNTFVFPDPGPAIIIDGPELYSTAFLWSLFNSERYFWSI